MASKSSEFWFQYDSLELLLEVYVHGYTAYPENQTFLPPGTRHLSRQYEEYVTAENCTRATVEHSLDADTCRLGVGLWPRSVLPDSGSRPWIWDPASVGHFDTLSYVRP